MTLRPLPRSRLDRMAPLLLRDSALVALVPVAEDDPWTVETAWNVARAAAAGSPRRRAVALVDLCLETPRLHQVKRVSPTPGIADAFAADTPLTDVARDVDGIHFIPAGRAGDPAAVRRTARWSRLRAGFRNEGALLLVCLPAERLQEFGACLDGILAVAPGGVDLGSPAGRALLAARDRGVELLGVVRERWSAAPPAGLGEAPGPRVPPRALAVAGAVAVVGTVLLLTSHPHPAAPTTRGAYGTAQAPATAVVPLVDSGGWTLQLAAYGAPARALHHAERLTAVGIPAFISPLAQDASGTVWYRVLVGTYPSRDSAAVARQALWQRGLAPQGDGTPLFAPYSLALSRPADVARLPGIGLMPLRWRPGGPIIIGAFEHPDQAAAAVAQLSQGDIATTLITRTDRTP